LVSIQFGGEVREFNYIVYASRFFGNINANFIIPDNHSSINKVKEREKSN
jgi:hypothetical protein